MAFIPSSSSGPQRFAGVLTLLIALAAILASGAVAAGWMQPQIATVTKVRSTLDPEGGGTSRDRPANSAATGSTAAPAPAQSRSPLGSADGYLPDDEVLSPWDSDHPALANLDPDLLDAIQQAAGDAETEGIVMVINSGWRSERYQQALLDKAIVTYGSETEARKWVAAPDESSHVSGDAVDIGDTDADYWLIEHGSEYGLCQTYENEVWHFELAIEPGGSCPPSVRDATESTSAKTGPVGSTSR